MVQSICGCNSTCTHTPLTHSITRHTPSLPHHSTGLTHLHPKPSVSFLPFHPRFHRLTSPVWHVGPNFTRASMKTFAMASLRFFAPCGRYIARTPSVFLPSLLLHSMSMTSTLDVCRVVPPVMLHCKQSLLRCHHFTATFTTWRPRRLPLSLSGVREHPLALLPCSLQLCTITPFSSSYFSAESLAFTRATSQQE